MGSTLRALSDLTSFAVLLLAARVAEWTPGDLVFWDNRCTLHQGSRYDTVNHRRRMHRSTIAGTEGPTF